jgi:hypothetical protein
MILGDRGHRTEVGSVKRKNRGNVKNIRLPLILNPLGFGVNIGTRERDAWNWEFAAETNF